MTRTDASIHVLLTGYIRRPGAEVDAALRGPGGLDVDAPGAFGHHQLAVQQNVEARRRVTFGAERTGLERRDLAVATQRMKLVVRQRFEQEQRAQLLRHSCPVSTDMGIPSRFSQASAR